LANPVPAPKVSPPEKPVPMLAFATESEAEAALQAGKIQAYYVLEQDYLTTSRAQLVYKKEPKQSARDQFRAFVVANLLADQPPEIAKRVAGGNNVIVRSPDGSREMSSNTWFNIVLPFIAGIIFFITIFTSAGYLMQAVVEEKENRTMEIVVTSVSPGQLMAGKTLGIIGVGLTQLLVWIGFVIIGIRVGQNYFAWLRGINVSAGTLGLIVAVMVPTFVMLSALMATIGATITQVQEGQQIVGLLTMPTWIPYMLTYPLMSAPNSPLAVGMSFFPLTAPLTMIIRSGFTVVPFWQIAVCVGLLTLCALGSLWLAGRAFRLGMLSYGKRLSLREVFRRQVQARQKIAGER
jgi:ABC-2 type transport system permease protein